MGRESGQLEQLTQCEQHGRGARMPNSNCLRPGWVAILNRAGCCQSSVPSSVKTTGLPLELPIVVRKRVSRGSGRYWVVVKHSAGR